MAVPVTESIAAALAPHVDRLALCVHRPASQDAELRRTAAALGLPQPPVLVVAARLLVADGLRPGDLAALNRYQPRTAMEAIERAHVERGVLVERADGVLVPTDALRRAAALVLRVQAEAATTAWGEASDAADAAEAIVARAVERADGHDELLAFRRQVETHPVREPPTSAAARLLDAVTELRYLRADAHAAALERAGVDARDAAELTRRWKGFGDPLPPDQAERRRAVEDDTNRRVADVLGRDHDASLERLLHLLEPLPGDDPRPIEDR